MRFLTVGTPIGLDGQIKLKDVHRAIIRRCLEMMHGDYDNRHKSQDRSQDRDDLNGGSLGPICLHSVNLLSRMQTLSVALGLVIPPTGYSDYWNT